MQSAVVAALRRHSSDVALVEVACAATANALVTTPTISSAAVVRLGPPLPSSFLAAPQPAAQLFPARALCEPPSPDLCAPPARARAAPVQPAAAEAVSTALRAHSSTPKVVRLAATALLHLSASSEASAEAVVAASAAESSIAALQACTAASDAARRSSSEGAGTSGAPADAATAVCKLLVSLCGSSPAARRRAGAAGGLDALSKALAFFHGDCAAARYCAAGVGAAEAPMIPDLIPDLRASRIICHPAAGLSSEPGG